MSLISDFIQYEFLTQALFGTIILALSCGLISPLVLARRQAFMGAAVSHSTFLGLASALAIFGVENVEANFFFTLFITMVLSIFLGHVSYRQKIPNDGLIGVFFTTSMGFGILIHNRFAQGSGDLLSILFGNILLITNSDILFAAVILIILALAILIPFKKWIYMTYDEEGAIVAGLPTYLFHLLFMALLAALIVSSIKLAGTVLINTLILIPGLFGLKFSKNLYQTFILSVVFSLSTSIIGLAIANAYNLPIGSFLAVFQFVILVTSTQAKRLLTDIV